MDSFDFSIIGKAIKKARIEQGMTQTQLSEKVGINMRYLQAIENDGQNVGFDIFYKLVTFFNISVDAYFYPDKNERNKRDKLVEIENSLFDLTDDELIIVNYVIKGIKKARRMII
jgi:transcriptional regulator with XRE-family HTH domain